MKDRPHVFVKCALEELFTNYEHSETDYNIFFKRNHNQLRPSILTLNARRLYTRLKNFEWRYILDQMKTYWTIRQTDCHLSLMLATMIGCWQQWFRKGKHARKIYYCHSRKKR